MELIDASALGIALIVDPENRLLFTLTDGDVRRALLRGLNLDMTVTEWAKRSPEAGNRRPTTAIIGTSVPELLRIMDAEGIRHVPIVDESGRVVDLATQSDILGAESTLPLTALLMAGGEGRRLMPLTGDLPKPMLPVGDRPLMEHIVAHLRDAGIQQVSISTHYKANHIVDHFGDGSAFGVRIDYLNEEQPLGTAGSLALAEPWSSTLLVMNGDVLTRLNCRAMLTFHHEHKALLTMAVRPYNVQVPYGVVDTSGVHVQGLREKPQIPLLVNAGVYLLEPEVRSYINPGERLDMPELIDRLLRYDRSVVSFPVSEYWIDIGHKHDYAQAQADLLNGRVRK